MNGIPLTPLAHFIRGVNRHYEQDAGGAITALNEVADAADKRLAVVANFWLGYESSNLGMYPEAIAHYQDAIRNVDNESLGHWELRKMELEAKFFDFASSRAKRGPDGPGTRRDANSANSLSIFAVSPVKCRPPMPGHVLRPPVYWATF